VIRGELAEGGFREEENLNHHDTTGTMIGGRGLIAN